MRVDRLWVGCFALVVGCGSTDAGPSNAGAGRGGSATGGSAQTGGASGSQASAGGGGAFSSGGSANANGGGAASPQAGSSPGTSGSGGASGSPGGAGGSAGRGGASSNGGSAANAGGGSGGAPASGGTGGCVQNLACKLQAPASSGDLHQDCVDRINQFRTQCACLPPLQRRMDGEACADQMAEYDAGKNKAHAGFSDKICQPSGAQNECPGYSSNNQVISLCMQQMWDEGPPDMTPCDGDCFQKYGHFINMTSTTSTKVACGFYTTASGKVWAVQNFLR